MRMLSAGFVVPFLLASIVEAAPGLDVVQLSKRQSITALSSEQISSFTPFTFFASAAYCNPNTTINFSCGANCAANPDFIPTASGGDGSSVQFWYVGFSPSQATVIVAHQGTNPKDFEAVATDLNVPFRSLDPTLFPGINSSVEAHSGFANEQAKTATDILSAVQSAIAAHSATQVTIVGHSLGAALALLDGVYLHLHIVGVSFRIIGYGLPRVGNKAFADYVDTNLAATTHINNKQDVIPIVPGISQGYQQTSGEIHILKDDGWVSCPGQDNPSTQCIAGDVSSILEGQLSDHDGPYNGVTMGCSS